MPEARGCESKCGLFAHSVLPPFHPTGRDWGGTDWLAILVALSPLDRNGGVASQKGGTRLFREACFDFSAALGVIDQVRTAPRCRSPNIVHSTTKVPRLASEWSPLLGHVPNFSPYRA